MRFKKIFNQDWDLFLILTRSFELPKHRPQNVNHGLVTRVGKTNKNVDSGQFVVCKYFQLNVAKTKKRSQRNIKFLPNECPNVNKC